MNDREDIIAEFEWCIASFSPTDTNDEYFKHVCQRVLELLEKQEPDQSKYEYKYDHTDCLWYQSNNWNQCPSTCSQYRDGWNDAMNYIFKDGKGYHPYKRR